MYLKQIGLLSFVGLAYLSPAHAQTDNRALEEIIVTANKRSESLHDVPISIGVIGGKLIEQYDITDLQDLQSFLPNLTVQRTFGNWAVRIRGLGSGVTNLAFDSSVSIFNDGVYCGRSRCLESAYMDVDRIEVARGPQGALFGKSTIAGALSVYAARPQDSLEAYIRGGAELENGGFTVAAMVTGPLADNLRGRIAAEIKDLDGWIDNPAGQNSEPQQKSRVLRGSLEWDISDNTDLYLKVEHFNTDLTGRTNQLVGSGGLFGALSQHPDKEFNRDSTRVVSTGTDREDFDQSQSTSITLQFNAQLKDHTLTAIANFWELEYDLFLDVDGVPELFVNTSLFEDYDQQSFEIRLLSPAEQRLNYTVGALYHVSDTKTRQFSPFGAWGPFAAAPNPVGGDRNFERKSDTISLYGQLSFDATDALRFIVDGRYTKEEQDGRGFSFPVHFPDNRTPERLPTALRQAPEYLFLQKRQDESFDLSIKVQYEVHDDVLLYAGYAEGSKPGGLKANDGNLGTQLLDTDDSAFYERFVGQPTVDAQDLIDGLTLQQGNGVFDFEDEAAENIEGGGQGAFRRWCRQLEFCDLPYQVQGFTSLFLRWHSVHYHKCGISKD